MVVCNRCGERTDSLVKSRALDLYLCEACVDSFNIWLDMRTNPRETHIESVKSVADAKRVMEEEGYIFYKKPKVWGQKKKKGEPEVITKK